jgi:hypothetical protein
VSKQGEMGCQPSVIIMMLKKSEGFFGKMGLETKKNPFVGFINPNFG